MKTFGKGCAVLGALASATALQAQAPETLFEETQIDVQASEAELLEPVRGLFAQDSMNIFRRFDPGLTNDMVRFYTGALNLRSLSPIQLTATQAMILTGVGSGQIKLSAGLPPHRTYERGGLDNATGLRLLILTYPDERMVTDSFVAAGFLAPVFVAQPDGSRVALVADPAGFPVEIIVSDKALPRSDRGAGVGINVSNLDESRTFYREFVGLDELEPQFDHRLGLMLYPYRHKETTLYLYQAGDGLPADTGSAGIQYVVSDAALADAKGKRRGVAVENPLNRLRGFDLTTVWLNDPDGVTNYFAQVGPRPQAKANVED